MILVIQNGNIVPKITKYLDEPYHIVKSYQTNVEDIDLNGYTIIVILGGNQSVVNLGMYPYLIQVVNLIHKCIAMQKMLIGICLGCHLIAHALGCTIIASPKLHIGYDTKILGLDNVFRCHTDYIVPNDNIQVVEYFDDMPYLYKHKHHIFGIQCHPDVAPECVKKYSGHHSSSIYANSNRDAIDNNNYTIIKHMIDTLRS